MPPPSTPIPVYLEIGPKRAFAGPLVWPGWCRIGKGEDAALQTLLDYGPRYARVVATTSLAFDAPTDVAAFAVVERLEGNSTTDFGAPVIPPAYDSDPMDAAEFARARSIIEATWHAFDRATDAARGKELTKGPRGGGRDLDGIVAHVTGADGGYLRRLGQTVPACDESNRAEWIALTRQTVLHGLAAAERGEIPERGPRGGQIWTPRYYVRRSTWHTLDHAWEIEDRIIP